MNIGWTVFRDFVQLRGQHQQEPHENKGHDLIFVVTKGQVDRYWSVVEKNNF